MKDIWTALVLVHRSLGGGFWFAKSLSTIFAALMCAVLHDRWWASEWWRDILAITPSMIGFSVGGFAVLIAFPSRQVLRHLSVDESDRPPPFARAAAWFAVLIETQLASLLLALVGSAFSSPVTHWHSGDYLLGGLSYFLFLASIGLSGTTVLALFDLSRTIVVEGRKEYFDEAVARRAPNGKDFRKYVRDLAKAGSSSIEKRFLEIESDFISNDIGNSSLKSMLDEFTEQANTAAKAVLYDRGLNADATAPARPAPPAPAEAPGGPES